MQPHNAGLLGAHQGEKHAAEFHAELTARIAAHGTPLVEDLPDDPDHQQVTFVWRAEKTVDGVYVLANRLTDKTHVDRGLMHRVGDSDLWTVSLRVPRGTMAGYVVFPFGSDDPALVDGKPSYTRELVNRSVPDPLSHDTRDGLPFGSLLRTSGAPTLDLWLPDRQPASSTLEEFDVIDAAGDSHHCRVAVTGPDPQQAVLLFDADRWFGRFDIVGAATRAIAAGLLEPLVLIGVDSPPTAPARLAQLGANESFVRAIAFEAVPRALDLVGVTPQRTIVAGQSLGGLSALSAAAWCAGVFDDVFAFSPSVWWQPGLTARPANVSDRVEWIHDLLATLPADAPRFALAVGANESELKPNVLDVADALSANDIRHTLQVFPGGHDYPWWADLLFDHLSPRPRLPYEVHR